MARIRGLRLGVLRSRDARLSIELGLATALGPLGGFVSNIVIARTLGASGRGELAAIVAALAVCEAVLAFGLPDIVARYIAKGIIPPGSQRTLAVGAVAASIIPGVVVALYCHSWSFSWPISIGAALLVPWTTATVIGRGVVLGHHAYRKLTASQLVGGIFRLLAPLTLILVDDPTENMGLAVVLSYIVAASIPIFWYRPFAGRAAPVRQVIPLLRESLIVWPVYAAWPIYMYLDQLVLSAVVSPADLGRYAVCAGIAQAPAALASGPRQILLARAAKSQNLDEIPTIAQSFLAAGIVGGAACGFLAGPILEAIFGPEFRGISAILGLLVAACGFDIALGMLNTGLLAVGRVRSSAINQGVALVLTAAALPIAVSLGGSIIWAAIVRLSASAVAFSLARLNVRQFSRSQESTSD
ncbi:oligosaccharide flippase family protein [Mycolicibacterium pallens]|nr:oligosaccharide flippase family protein [Mycolicibacterium pallens]